MHPTAVDSNHPASEESGQHIYTPSPPINRVPFDVFQIIFTLEGNQECLPWTTSHVCRLWREYVLAMPLLWNRLDVNRKEPRWDMLEAKLERSGQAPLDIYIGRETFSKRALPHLRRTMRLILPHSGRWRTLQIENIPHKVKRILLDQLKTRPTPLLIDFQLLQQTSNFDALTSKDTSPHWSAKGVLDGLAVRASVTWETRIVDIQCAPHFKNLRSLTTGDETLEELDSLQFVKFLWRILTDSPALEHLQLEYPAFNWYSKRADSNTYHRMPHLTHYSLRCLHLLTSYELQSTILDFLILPALQRLGPAYFQSLVALSSCRTIAEKNNIPLLRAITIVHEGEEGRPRKSDQYFPYLNPALGALTNLRVLTFRYIDFEGDKWVPRLGSLCPQLRWLLLVMCQGFTITTIKRIVSTRIEAEGISRLDVLCIQPRWDKPLDTTPSAEDIKWFNKLLKFKEYDDCHYTEKEDW